MRCGTSGTSWHVTAKSSICAWGVLYKSGVYAVKALCLTPGDLHSVRGIGLREEVTLSDRCAEVSRGHSRSASSEGPNGAPVRSG